MSTVTQPISSIMTTDVLKVTTDHSLNEVQHLLTTNKFRHVPVVKDDALIGILSLTDLQRLSFEASFEDDHDVDLSINNMLTVEQVMKHHPTTVSSDDQILKAAEILTTAEFHALPVVDNGHLVGIVTTTDIIKYLISCAQ